VRSAESGASVFLLTHCPLNMSYSRQRITKPTESNVNIEKEIRFRRLFQRIREIEDRRWSSEHLVARQHWEEHGEPVMSEQRTPNEVIDPKPEGI